MNFDGLRSQVLVLHKLKVVRLGIESGTDKKVLFSAFLAKVDYLACLRTHVYIQWSYHMQENMKRGLRIHIWYIIYCTYHTVWYYSYGTQHTKWMCVKWYLLTFELDRMIQTKNEFTKRGNNSMIATNPNVKKYPVWCWLRISSILSFIRSLWIHFTHFTHLVGFTTG